MTASLDQNFVTYQGDNVNPIYTVLNSAGTAVDISGVNQITWALYADNDMSATPILTKTKTGSQITFVNTGTDGKFQVAILPADTQALSGFYQYRAYILDGNNNVTTTSIGRMQVGLVPSWTYNPAKLATNQVYQVRRLIGDVLIGDQQLTDQEIVWYVNSYGNVFAAASFAARGLGAQFARMVDTVQGELHTLYSQRAKNYFSLAEQLLQQSKARGGARVFAGGINISDKTSQLENTDRVPPQFNLMIFDNLLPESPVGQQVPGARAPNSVPVTS